MSCKNRLTIKYKDQDIENLVRENPSWSTMLINASLIKKWGHGRSGIHISNIKKRILKEINYKKTTPRYEHRKKDPKGGGFWD